MADPADAKSGGRSPMLMGLCVACGAMVGMGFASSWTLENMLPPAIGAGIATAMYQSALARGAPTWLRFLGMLVLAGALGLVVHVLLELR